MTDEEKLCHDLTYYHMLSALCPDCKERPELKYEPGTTIIFCPCRNIPLPDWSPREAMQTWNGCIMRGNFREKTIAELIGKFANAKLNRPTK